ncbi:MAG TPA: hypothetical protein VE957_10445 [Terriglobales bacterium]|nr:hypothetical protein [Terriglobales bacterium]
MLSSIILQQVNLITAKIARVRIAELHRSRRGIVDAHSDRSVSHDRNLTYQFKHEVPKEPGVIEPRINLTVRRIEHK